jgi:hypothetical protein
MPALSSPLAVDEPLTSLLPSSLSSVRLSPVAVAVLSLDRDDDTSETVQYFPPESWKSAVDDPPNVPDGHEFEPLRVGFDPLASGSQTSLIGF